MASSISFWQVLVSVHSSFWRVFEKNGFPHCNMYIVISQIKANTGYDDIYIYFNDPKDAVHG